MEMCVYSCAAADYIIHVNIFSIHMSRLASDDIGFL